MPMNCCVYGCTNRKFKESSKPVRFFRFPSNVMEHRSSQREKWINAVKRINTDDFYWKPSKYMRICSEHFITGEPRKEENHPDFVPSIFNHKKSENYRKFQCSQLQRSNENESISNTEDMHNAPVNPDLAPSPSDIEERVRVLQNIHVDSAATTIRKQLPAIRSAPWWSPQLTSLRKLNNRLRRRYQREKNSAIRAIRERAYKYAASQYKQALFSAKLNWKNDCSSKGEPRKEENHPDFVPSNFNHKKSENYRKFQCSQLQRSNENENISNTEDMHKDNEEEEELILPSAFTIEGKEENIFIKKEPELGWDIEIKQELHSKYDAGYENITIEEDTNLLNANEIKCEIEESKEYDDKIHSTDSLSYANESNTMSVNSEEHNLSISDSNTAVTENINGGLKTKNKDWILA